MDMSSNSIERNKAFCPCQALWKDDNGYPSGQLLQTLLAYSVQGTSSNLFLMSELERDSGTNQIELH